MTASPDPYDDALSVLRSHVDNLGAWLAIWGARQEGRPDAHARRCASDAIDAAIRDLHVICARLVGEIRAADDAATAEADALLEQM